MYFFLLIINYYLIIVSYVNFDLSHNYDHTHNYVSHNFCLCHECHDYEIKSNLSNNYDLSYLLDWNFDLKC